MELERFLETATASDRSLVVLNRRAPDPVMGMFEDLVGDQSIELTERSSSEAPADTVVLIEDESVIATSSLDELQDAILLINSDLFITGARSLGEIEVPDVLAGLAETEFYLRGYPESHKEKLLLILISRYIERTAWEQGHGTLRTGLQHLDRIEDEVGTAQAYRRIAETDVDVHLYGAPGWEPNPELSTVVHGAYTEAFLRSWFVVYRDSAGEESCALLAIEDAPNEWRGLWTYRESVVADIADHIAQTM